MLFTSVSFAVFFAVVFFGYYALPHRFRWMLLLVASWTFYGWMSPYYLIFLAFATVITYCAAIAMDAGHCAERRWISANGKSLSRDEKRTYKNRMDGRRRRWCGGAIFALLAMLAVFKYLEFLLDNVAWLSGVLGLSWRAPALNLILPIGLSFYVFQSMAYVIDVLRGEVAAERSFFRHALFVSYFPQIMQGPIGNYGRLAHQFFERHDFDYEQVVMGGQRIAWGFFKKLAIANVIADWINPTWSVVADYPGASCWILILFLYAVQLYADFSGYMDIACGCSQMLGIRLDENFNCPYLSRSVDEYWRRWHMTLSSWFRDYLFYPILRSDWNTRLRKCFQGKYLASVVPTSVALAIVWAVTGLWHGASWGYVAWGCYYGVFMVLGIVLAPAYNWWHGRFPALCASRFYACLQVIRTMIIVLIGYAIFKPASIGATGGIFRQLADCSNMQGLFTLARGLSRPLWPLVAGIVLLLAVDVVHYVRGKDVIRKELRRLPLLVRWMLYSALMFMSLFFGLYGQKFAAFEYFRF